MLAATRCLILNFSVSHKSFSVVTCHHLFTHHLTALNSNHLRVFASSFQIKPKTKMEDQHRQWHYCDGSNHKSYLLGLHHLPIDKIYTSSLLRIRWPVLASLFSSSMSVQATKRKSKWCAFKFSLDRPSICRGAVREFERKLHPLCPLRTLIFYVAPH